MHPTHWELLTSFCSGATRTAIAEKMTLERSSSVPQPPSIAWTAIVSILGMSSRFCTIPMSAIFLRRRSRLSNRVESRLVTL